jgi:hypothetical protein
MVIQSFNLSKTLCYKPGFITLNCSTDRYLILYTHLHPMGFLLGGREVRLRALFFSRASISFSIASLHNGDFIAWEKVLGSFVEQIVEINPLCASEKLEREILMERVRCTVQLRVRWSIKEKVDSTKTIEKPIPLAIKKDIEKPLINRC